MLLFLHTMQVNGDYTIWSTNKIRQNMMLTGVRSKSTTDLFLIYVF